VDGLADFFRRFVAENDVEALLSRGLEHDFRYPWMQMLHARKRLTSISDSNLEDSGGYVFESPKSQELLSTLLKVAQFDCNVLITGETGVGKGIAAEILYRKSKRREGNFVKINCASIPEQLLESELFGYEGGAFTGSNPKGKAGFWEIADGGVLFLDEIGEMSLLLQSKLLRAIEENEIYRVGGEAPILVDVRVIAATNRNLYDMVKEKKFREDLYYRLNVFHLHIPPLRERREDIVPLIDLMVRRYGKKFGISKMIAREAKELMESFAWEGNARELENFVQKLFISSLGNEITLHDVTDRMILFRESFLPAREQRSPARAGKFLSEEEERELYRRYKEEYKSTRRIAEALGTSQSSVVRRLRKYGL
jgi:transcriptional regulator with PAS, ATPase and Fis domain